MSWNHKRGNNTRPGKRNTKLCSIWIFFSFSSHTKNQILSPQANCKWFPCKTATCKFWAGHKTMGCFIALFGSSSEGSNGFVISGQRSTRSCHPPSQQPPKACWIYGSNNQLNHSSIS